MARMKTVSTGYEPEPRGRRGERPIFAFGDMHGHLEPFERLLDHVAGVVVADYADEPVDAVFLGDFVDRGPDSAGVMRRAMRGLAAPNARTIALMGNHDRYLAQAAGIGGRRMGARDWTMWHFNGGADTLDSFGLPPRDQHPPEAIRDAMGDELTAWLGGLRGSWRSGEVFCTHAGVDPDIAIEDQTEEALLWIREPFLSLAARSDGAWPFSVTVVHGHTIGSHGLFQNRIGVDTGGYHTGVFSAVEISSGGVRFHHVIVK